MFEKMMKYVYIDYIYVKLLVWKIKFVLINFIGCYIEFCIFLMINCLCILLNSVLYFILLMYVCICINFFEYVLLIKFFIFKI